MSNKLQSKYFIMGVKECIEEYLDTTPKQHIKNCNCEDIVCNMWMLEMCPHGNPLMRPEVQIYFYINRYGKQKKNCIECNQSYMFSKKMWKQYSEIFESISGISFHGVLKDFPANLCPDCYAQMHISIIRKR